MDHVILILIFFFVCCFVSLFFRRLVIRAAWSLTKSPFFSFLVPSHWQSHLLPALRVLEDEEKLLELPVAERLGRRPTYRKLKVCAPL